MNSGGGGLGGSYSGLVVLFGRFLGGSGGGIGQKRLSGVELFLVLILIYGFCIGHWVT